jgi:hypothetical protein
MSRYADGHLYAEGHVRSAEADLSRGATPRAPVGVAYVEGEAMVRRGPPEIGIWPSNRVASKITAGKLCWKITINYFLKKLKIYGHYGHKCVSTTINYFFQKKELNYTIYKLWA